MNTDLSAAPEIARLAMPSAPASDAARPPSTDGRLAAGLAGLAATPQRWWDLVRFDPGGPLRIPVPDAAPAWLLVLPPGAAADCDCRLATVLAGEAAEVAGKTAGKAAGGMAEGAGEDRGARPLRPGRVRVRGIRAAHRHLAAGPGYSVTLHA